MDDLEAVAKLPTLLFFSPLAVASALAISSLWRCLAGRDQARVYAAAAAFCLGALAMSILVLPLGFVPMAVLGILGLGTWAANVILSPARLLWVDGIAIAIGLGATAVWIGSA